MKNINLLFLFTLLLVISSENKAINLQNSIIKKSIIYAPSVVGGIYSLRQAIHAYQELNKNIMEEHNKETAALNANNPEYPKKTITPRIKIGRFPHLAKYYDARDRSYTKAGVIALCSFAASFLLDKILAK